MALKILHIATDVSGGAGRAMLCIHRALLNEGIDSVVLVRDNLEELSSDYICSMKLSSPEGFWYATRIGRFIRRILRGLDIYISKRDFILTQRKTIDRNVCFTLPISEYKVHLHSLIDWADIIHLHWIQDFIDFPTFFANVHKPILWTCHDLNPMMGGFHHIRLRTQYIHQWGKIEQACYDIKNVALKKCKNLSAVALSSEMHQMLKNHEFFMSRNIYDIANCVDTDVFNLKDKQHVRAKYNIPINAYILLFANGNLNDTEKGLQELIKALEILYDMDFTLMCVGNGIIPKSNLSVIHLPRVTNQHEMAEMYQIADMLVMPSHQEAFALTPLEAMSCGKPVVITPVSGAKDLMRDFAGEISTDFTSDSLANAVRKAMDKKYNDQQIRNYIINNYHPNIIGKKYIDVYKKIIKDF